MSKNMDEFKRGAEVVGKAAADKFDQISSEIGSIKENLAQQADAQDEVNTTTTARVDALTDEMRALKDNRQYIKSSRHSLDDMEIEEQQLVLTWLSKVLEEMAARGFSPSEHQQVFYSNLSKYIGMLDESFQIEDLSILEKMGEGATHLVIYKIFLAFVYLYDGSFDPLEKLADIDGMFKLSVKTKSNELEMLQQRALPLGIEGLAATYDQERPISSFTVANVLSNHIELEFHPAQTWNLRKNQLEDYVRSFALVALHTSNDDSVQFFSFTDKQKEFLVALSKRLGCHTALFDLNELCKNPSNVNIESLKTILADSKKKYTWLLDVIFLAKLSNKFKENSELFSSLVRVIKLDDTDLPGFILAAGKFVDENAPQELFDLIAKKINVKTDGWKHILAFRGLTLKWAFEKVRDQLCNLTDVTGEIQSSALETLMDCSQLLFESSIIQGMKRGKLFSKLNNDKNRAVSLVRGEGRTICTQAIRIVDLYIADSSYSKSLLKVGFAAEELSSETFAPSSGIDDWYNDFERGANKTEALITSLNKLADDLYTQLGLFQKNQFNETVDEVRLKEADAKSRAEEEERLAKAVATLEHDGKQIRMCISWEDWDMENLPFDPADLEYGATNGSIWLVSTDKNLYACSDGNKWVSLTELLGRDGGGDLSVKFIHGIWIVEDNENIYVSDDTKRWKRISQPESSCYRPSPCVFFNGKQWILRIEQEQTYSYKEKGLIFSSTKEYRYDAPQFYRADKLDGGWKEWREASDVNSGYVSRGNFVANKNVTVAAFDCDGMYSHNKHGEMDHNGLRLMYLKANKSWERADLPEKIFDSTPKLGVWNERFFLATANAIYTSEKGFVWEKLELQSSVNWGEFRNMLVAYPHRKDQILLSADGKTFCEMKLDKGEWSILAGHDDSLLAVCRENSHEASLKLGTVHYEIE